MHVRIFKPITPSPSISMPAIETLFRAGGYRQADAFDLDGHDTAPTLSLCRDRAEPGDVIALDLAGFAVLPDAFGLIGPVEPIAAPEWVIYIPEEGHWPIAYRGRDRTEARRTYLAWAGRTRLPAGSFISSAEPGL